MANNTSEEMTHGKTINFQGIKPGGGEQFLLLTSRAKIRA